MICKILPETRASKGFAGTKPIKVSQNPGIPPLSAYSLEAWTPKLAKLIPSPGLKYYTENKTYNSSNDSSNCIINKC